MRVGQNFVFILDACKIQNHYSGEFAVREGYALSQICQYLYRGLPEGVFLYRKIIYRVNKSMIIGRRK